MNRLIRTVTTLAASSILLLASEAAAQPVFFDDFDGDSLQPHWVQPFPQDWTYNVSNSMLNVTGLHYPSHPQSPGNIAAMSALFAPQGDFRLDGDVCWEFSAGPQRLGLSARTGQGGAALLASIQYSFGEGLGQGPLIIAGSSDGVTILPAPPPGLHRFSIVRTGQRFEYYLNDELIRTSRDIIQFPVNGVAVEFVGPFPGPIGEYSVDNIRVIPAPSAGLVILSLVINMRCRRRV